MANPFRFSLRSVFILITLFCICAAYLGYEANWIRRRTAFFIQQKDTAHFHWFNPTYNVHQYNGGPLLLWLWDKQRISKILITVDQNHIDRMEGASPVMKITNPVLVNTQKLFPEATIIPQISKGEKNETVLVED